MAEHILLLSYGKDSLACLGAIKLLGWPLDRIITADVWATPTIRGELPEMVEFKQKADKIIFDRYGIKVEHLKSDLSYEECFYRERFNKKYNQNQIYGFPIVKGAWCNDRLKMRPLKEIQKGDIIQYLGIAADEPKRISRHIKKPNIKLPLVEVGWQEDYCGLWCKYSKLLSPTYTTSARDGCWFCHNQGVEQLRLLRKKHPDLWQILLKWDRDSPVSFRPDGHTVHDFEERFMLEDAGFVDSNEPWRWQYLNCLQLNLFGSYIKEMG